MNLSTINVDRQQAREAFLHYRRAVRERHNREDQLLMRGYRALSQGRQVIDLKQTISAGGQDEGGRPKLAVARATWKKVFLIRHRWENYAVEFLARPSWEIRSHETRARIKLPADTLPPQELKREAYAVVPNVPPQLRPADKLENYFVLFEAEWQGVPVDPALLKHLGGSLYVVLAVWDLTPLERAVLGITRA
jgi:hypothetical protein